MRHLFQSSLLVTLVLVFSMGTPASAQLVPAAAGPKMTTVQFKRSPGNQVVIESDGAKIKFTACRYGMCSPVGKSEGYTSAELTQRYKVLRKSVWMNRLFVIPAGALCAGLLGAAVGYWEVRPILDVAHQATQEILQNTQQYIENADNLGEVMVAPIVAMGGLAAAGGVSMIGLTVAYAVIHAYAVMGVMVGLPGTWLLTKFLRPNFSRASRQIQNGIEFETAEVTTGQDFEKYVESLKFALGSN